MSNEFSKDQEIYHTIGSLLWMIFPNEANKINISGAMYDQHNGCALRYFINQTPHSFPFDKQPDDIIEKIMQEVNVLKQLPLFSKDPFTQFRATLTSNKKFNIEFAYIPEEDSWPGLFMRAVSELTEEEAKQMYIPAEEWQKRVEQFRKDK